MTKISMLMEGSPRSEPGYR